MVAYLSAVLARLAACRYANLIAHYQSKHSAIVERLHDIEEKQIAAQVVRDEDGTQAFKDAVNTFVQSLGRTEVPDSDGEEEEEESE